MQKKCARFEIIATLYNSNGSFRVPRCQAIFCTVTFTVLGQQEGQRSGRTPSKRIALGYGYQHARMRTILPETDVLGGELLVAGVAQWLERRSLAGGLSVPDLWLTCDHFVGKLSAMGQPTRPTQPSIPPGSVNK